MALLVALVMTDARAADDRPNVLLIIADDLGYADPTPNLDVIASEGIAIPKMHAYAMCTPARAAVMTGSYSERLKIWNALSWDSKIGVGAGERTLPKMFKEAGYTTALMGKWHLGNLPQFSPLNHFDVFKGNLEGQIDQFSHIGVDGTVDWWNGAARDLTREYSTTAITRDAIDFMTTCHEPWFLISAYTAVHTPNQGPTGIMSRPQQLKDLDVEATRLAKAAPQNTLIWFLSDNGGEPGHNGTLRGGKGGLYEGGWRVRSWIKWDGHLTPGSTGRMASVTDIMPTLAELLGLDVGRAVDGVSLAPALTGKPWGPVRDIYASHQTITYAEIINPWKMVLIGTKAELYNLDNDPRESVNVAGKYPAQVTLMKSNIAKWRKQVGR